MKLQVAETQGITIVGCGPAAVILQGEYIPVASRFLEFGDFKLDCDRFELFRAGRAVKLERKPMELLILLAAGIGDLISRTEIAERLWERDVFVDTEHGINTAIRKIRQVLRDDPERPQFIQTVTGKGYRFVAAKVDVGPAVNGTSQTSPADISPPPETLVESPTAKAASLFNRPFLWLAVAATVAALVLAAILIRRNSTQPAIRSLAVLPLDNLSADPGQDYLAGGMTDELTTMLAKSSTLRVVSRTSVMRYKGAARPMSEIGAALGVDGVLEGSVSRAGNRVHMTIQLIDAHSDTHLWAESYDRDANDLVSLPRDAALTIAKRLNSAVPRSAQERFVSPEAHDAYYHGQYLWLTGFNDKAGEYFKKATQLQPDYALGWSGLSAYYGVDAIEGNRSPAETLPQLEVTARKAVELDDSLAEAHLAMCAALFAGRWDFAGADRECLRAIELNPRYAAGYHFRAKIFAILNRHPEAIAVEKTASELDPFSPSDVAFSLNLARRYDEALGDARQRLVSYLHEQALRYQIFCSYRCKGMGEEAEKAFEEWLASINDQAAIPVVRRAYQQEGFRGVVKHNLDYYLDRAKTHYVSPVFLSDQYAQLGDRENTLTNLEKALAERSPLLLWVQFDPAYDFVHSETRYRNVIKGVGLPGAW